MEEIWLWSRMIRKIYIFCFVISLVFLFYSWYVILGCVRNMMIFCSEDLFWFQIYWSRDILHRNFRLLFGNSMVVIQTLFTNSTPLCNICWRVCSLTVTYDWFAVILGKIVTGATCGAGNYHPFLNTWFHSLWGVHDFTQSLYIHCILLNLSVLGLCLRIVCLA